MDPNLSELLAGHRRFNGSHFRAGRGAQEKSERADPAVSRNPPGDGKVASIINRYIDGFQVEKLYLVGGAYGYPGMTEVIEDMTGIETILPGNPLFVTPLGIAMHNH